MKDIKFNSYSLEEKLASGFFNDKSYGYDIERKYYPEDYYCLTLCEDAEEEDNVEIYIVAEFYYFTKEEAESDMEALAKVGSFIVYEMH